MQRGSLEVTNCRFTCEVALELTSDLTTIYPDKDISTASEEYDGNDYNEVDWAANEEEAAASVTDYLRVSTCACG